MNNQTILKILSLSAVALSFLFYSCDNGKREIYAVDGSGNLQTLVSVSKPDSTRQILNVYMDNTGSMDGYMCKGSQLKDAVYDYLSYLRGYVESTELFYINKRIIPYKGNLESFVKDLDPDSFRRAGGNRADTDIGQMIADIVKNTNDSTIVSIFISDCILDLPTKDSKHFLNNCQIKVRNAISEHKKENPKFSVEILKMWSDFEGNYYYPDGGAEKLKDVKRPYYIWLFGGKEALAKLNEGVPFSTLEKYGLTDILSLTPFETSSHAITNDKLTGSLINPMKDKYHVILRADLSTTLQPHDVITDVSNYSFNDKSIVLEYIKPITAKGSSYTHTLGISIPISANLAESKTLIFSAPEIPLWLSESNDETGVDILNNIEKTTGIKNIVMGVVEAYQKEEALTKFKFSVKR